MKTVVHSSAQKLSCPCDSDVIVCIADTLTASGAPFIEGTLVKTISTISSCNNPVYNYYIDYNETDLLDPAYTLVNLDIGGVICRGCLTSYIENQIPIPVDSIANICFVSNDTEFAAAIAAGACRHIVTIGSFAMGANRIVPDTKVLTCLRNCEINTNGFVLTINGHFAAPGNYPCFITTDQELTFAPGAVKEVVPQWFGALGDGINDDGPAINAAVWSIRNYFYNPLNLNDPVNVTADIFFPSGTYYTTVSLNFTGIKGFVLHGTGPRACIINFGTAGEVGLDLTAAFAFSVRDIQFSCKNDLQAPSVGILQARNINGTQSGTANFHNVIFHGPTDADGTTFKAAVYQIGCEDVEYYATSILITNKQSVGWYVTGYNDLGIVSLYHNMWDAATYASNSVMSFTGGSISNQGLAAGADSAICVYVNDARSLVIQNSGMSTSGDYFIYVKSNVTPVAMVSDLNLMGNKFEAPAGTQPLYVLYGDPTTRNLALGAIIGNTFRCEDCVIKQTGGTTPAIYLGAILANTFNEGACDTFIDSTGELVGGLVDCYNMKIKANMINSGIYFGFPDMSDIIVTSPLYLEAGNIFITRAGVATSRVVMSKGLRITSDNFTALVGAEDLHADVLANTGGFDIAAQGDPVSIREHIGMIGIGNHGMGGSFRSYKTRSTDGSADVTVQDGDVCLRLLADAADGTNFKEIGGFTIEVDGVPAPGLVPGRYVFKTGSAAGILRERWRINSSGELVAEPTFGGDIVFQTGIGFRGTPGGPRWDGFGAYNAGAPGATGYVDINIGGVPYKILVST